VLNSGSCGSGSVVGKRNGKTLVLTNAHVAGTTIGRVVQCQFPYHGNVKVNARVIMAAYSDKVMMDWSVIEIDQDIPLTAVKLSIAAPTGDHYTMGYPRCEGPYSQRLKTVTFTHNGTVWRWQPISIGGQSGSAVHSFADNLQKGLLTWSWAGDGAGQTTKAIWFQYNQRAAVGFERPEGLIELNNRCDGLENGFFAESSINDLPIWAHLDTPTTPPVTPPNDKEFRDLVLKHAEALVALAKSQPSVGGGNPEPDDGGGTFGL
jgi:outer membrane lipoprotein SlyB